MNSTNKPQYIYAVKLTILFSTIIGLLLISLSSLWLNRVVFDTDTFTSTATDALLAQSSRDSIGRLVADRAFAEQPVLGSLLSEPLANYVSSFLGSDAAQSGIERVVREGQLLFTTPQKPPVVLDLLPYKSVIATAQEVIPNDSEERLSVESIPDVVVIIDTDRLPNFYQYSLYTHFAGPASLVAAGFLAGFWIWRGKARRYQRTRTILVVVIATSVIALIIGPLVEPAFISVGRDAASQTLLSNLYKSFVDPFRVQALWLGAIATFSLGVLIAVYEIKNAYKIEFKITKR